MNIQIIQVPYDSGHEGIRTGRGPDHFMQRSVDTILRNDGHQVASYRITSKAAFQAENETGFELNRLLAEQVDKAIKNQQFPLILTGTCYSCVGAIAGVGLKPLGIIWLDAHGDFNTPDTTTSGMMHGMGLAMATGRGWRALLKTVPGFSPIPDEDVIHFGGRDFDPEEGTMLQQSSIQLVPPKPDLDQMRQGLESAFVELSKRVKKVYLHFDVDVLDIEGAMPNYLAVPGGPSAEFVEEVIGMIRSMFEVSAATVASYEPDYDKDDKVLNASIRIMRAIVA